MTLDDTKRLFRVIQGNHGQQLETPAAANYWSLRTGGLCSHLVNTTEYHARHSPWTEHATEHQVYRNIS